MAVDNVKAAFHLPGEVNEDTNKNNKTSTNSHQKVFQNIYRKRPVLKFLLNEVSGLQLAALSKKSLRDTGFLIRDY